MAGIGQFELKITGVGKHGCDSHSIEGESLRTRCNRLNCVDCLSYDFVQLLRQKGFRLTEAIFTHHIGATHDEDIVIDDVLTNSRLKGRF